jgi:hypothetical protein
MKIVTLSELESIFARGYGLLYGEYNTFVKSRQTSFHVENSKTLR